MKHNRNPLAKAISYALGAGMIASLAMTASPVAAQADGEEDADLDRIQVTGSRISRADIEGALPVTVIDREDIDFSGKTSVADLLQDTTFNSFGSFRPQSGSSAQSWAGLNLRGLGSGRTLILIDGKRAPLGPQIGGAQDLNVIPIAAVERVEILTDGASAIYGSDAIGGVVNIITRKDFSGAEFMYGQGRPKEEGGDTREASAVMGIAGDRGQIMVGAGLTDRDIIFARDREWSSNSFSAYSNNFINSLGGDFYVNPVHGIAVPADGCTGPGFVVSEGQCLYEHSLVDAHEAELKNRSLFARGTYEINSDWSTYLNASVTRATSFGRYAPAPTSPWPGTFPHLAAGSPNHPATPPSEGGLNPFWEDYQDKAGQDLWFIHRFAALGTRDGNTDNNAYDLTAGVQGHYEGWDLDFGYRHSQSKFYDVGLNYPVGGLAQGFIDSGVYNIYDPFSVDEDIANSMIATILRSSEFSTRELFASASTSFGELQGGPIGFAVGVEYRDEIYADIYDSLSEGGQIVGSAGNSAAGDRDVTAGFFELLFPVLDNFEIGLAGRYDDYSDYGSDFSPKVSLRFQPLDELTLRASWGEGFAAPTLDILTQKPAFSAESIAHEPTAEFLGTPGESVQVSTYSISNPDLESETSKQFSIGAAYAPTDWINGSIDYYNIELTDSISSISLSTIVRCLEGRTENCPPGLSEYPAGSPFQPTPEFGLGAAFGPNGEIRWAQTGFANLGTLKSDGLDVNIRTNFDFGEAGRLNNELQLGRVLSYKVDSGANVIGELGLPKFRLHLNNRWSVGDFAFAWNIRVIDKQNEKAQDEDENTPSWVTHNVQANWYAPWNARISVGVDNVGNKMPPIDQGLLRGFNDELYNGYGRIPYLRYTQSF